MSDRIYSFEPLVNSRCRVLLLGTMPGVESLRRQQYYGHPQNAFWRIMGAIAGFSVDTDYDARCEELLKKHIALWDVIHSCVRQSSADSKIKDAIPNDVGTLLDNYPNVRHIFFNGRKAQQFFDRHIMHIIGRDDITYTYLPSTSPANAQISFAEKRDIWQQAINSTLLMLQPEQHKP